MVDHQHPTDWLSSSKSASRRDESKPSWTRRHKTGLGIVFAGVVAGGVLAGTLGASAATGSATPAGEGPGYGMGHGIGPEGGHAGPPGGPGLRRPDEKPLSAALTASLKAKALLAVPGGTVTRVGSGHGDAVYDAHVTKSDGTKVRVEFDKNQKVLRIEADKWIGGPGKGGPHGGPGPRPEGGNPPSGVRPEGGTPPNGVPPMGGPRGMNPEAAG
jgi:hypothetical protein